MQEEVVTLRCPCGYAILCEVWRLVERMGTVAFFDDESTSETYGERIRNCPGYGEQLEFLTLLLRYLRR